MKTAIADIGCLGVSHRTTSLSFLESWTRSHESLRANPMAIATLAGCRELVFLATCNRLEIYYVRTDARTHAAESAAAFGVRPEDTTHFEHAFGMDAVGHLFRVASGLDSMVLGEAQILGQVKAAHRLARERGTIGPLLDRIFQAAFHASKEVRHRTGIGAGSVSVASLGVREAIRVHEGATAGPGDSPLRVAILGAGLVANKVASHLTARRPVELTIANRGRESGEGLALEFNAAFRPLADFFMDPPPLDIIFVATGAPDPVLTPESACRILERAPERLVIVDLSLPRNADPALAAEPGVMLLDLDRLQAAARENQRLREDEIAEAGEILAMQVDRLARRERIREDDRTRRNERADYATMGSGGDDHRSSARPLGV